MLNVGLILCEKSDFVTTGECLHFMGREFRMGIPGGPH